MSKIKQMRSQTELLRACFNRLRNVSLRLSNFVDLSNLTDNERLLAQINREMVDFILPILLYNTAKSGEEVIMEDAKDFLKQKERAFWSIGTNPEEEIYFRFKENVEN